jgi:hypothetical protein
MGMAPGQTPLFYRVEEAAEILRISRSSAYELANAWLRSDGHYGLPASDSAAASSCHAPSSTSGPRSARSKTSQPDRV